MTGDRNAKFLAQAMHASFKIGSKMIHSIAAFVFLQSRSVVTIFLLSSPAVSLSEWNHSSNNRTTTIAYLFMGVMRERAWIVSTPKKTFDSTFLGIVVRHWACWMCRGGDPEIVGPDSLLLDHTSSIMDDDSSDALPKTPIFFPVDEIYSLQRRHEALASPLLGVIERPPIASGVLKNVQLLGVFPTCRWLGDPTMPPDVKELFGGTPFFPLGEYRVANLDLVDAAGTLHALTMIVNKGVEGMQTGYWGAAFGRQAPHVCWARFEMTGENETTVKHETIAKSGSSRAVAVFEEYADSLEFFDDYFQKENTPPGTCKTQQERVLGLAAEFLLGLQWSMWLPDQLIEVRDTSCRLERKRRARIVRQRTSRRSLLVDDPVKNDGDIKSRKPEKE